MAPRKRQWSIGFAFLCHVAPTVTIILTTSIRQGLTDHVGGRSIVVWYGLLAALMLGFGHALALALYRDATRLRPLQIYILSAVAGSGSLLALMASLFGLLFVTPVSDLAIRFPAVLIVLAAPVVSILVSLGILIPTYVVSPDE